MSLSIPNKRSKESKYTLVPFQTNTVLQYNTSDKDRSLQQSNTARKLNIITASQYNELDKDRQSLYKIYKTMRTHMQEWTTTHYILISNNELLKKNKILAQNIITLSDLYKLNQNNRQKYTKNNYSTKYIRKSNKPLYNTFIRKFIKEDTVKPVENSRLYRENLPFAINHLHHEFSQFKKYGKK